MKYSLTTESKNISGVTVYRIKAETSFGDVKRGDLGGFIEGERNLSHEGNAWVYDKACVCERAQVYGDARVFGEACVCERAQVYDDARVFGRANVYGNARVYEGAVVCDRAHIYGEARVRGDAEIGDEAHIYGDARVSGEARVCGDARVFNSLHLSSGHFFGKRGSGEDIIFVRVSDDMELVCKGDVICTDW